MKTGDKEDSCPERNVTLVTGIDGVIVDLDQVRLARRFREMEHRHALSFPNQNLPLTKPSSEFCDTDCHDGHYRPDRIDGGSHPNKLESRVECKHDLRTSNFVRPGWFYGSPTLNDILRNASDACLQ